MLEADDPGGAELCSLAPVDWSASLAGMALLSAEFVLPAAEFGPAELCSAAPPDVSALPDGGTVAQPLSRNIPIDNLLRFSPRRRTRYSEIVRKKSNKNGKEHTR